MLLLLGEGLKVQVLATENTELPGMLSDLKIKVLKNHVPWSVSQLSCLGVFSFLRLREAGVVPSSAHSGFKRQHSWPTAFVMIV